MLPQNICNVVAYKNDFPLCCSPSRLLQTLCGAASRDAKFCPSAKRADCMRYDPNDGEFCVSGPDYSNNRGLGAKTPDAMSSVCALAFPEPVECTSPARELYTVHGAQDRPLHLVVHTYSENVSFNQHLLRNICSTLAIHGFGIPLHLQHHCRMGGACGLCSKPLQRAYSIR